MFANIDINQIKKLTQKEFDQFYELEGWSSTHTTAARSTTSHAIARMT